MKNKKAAILLYPIMVGFIAGLVIFFFASIKEAPVEKTAFIGELQLNLLKTAQKAEMALLYIDNSAKLASYQSVYDLGANGGFSTEPGCGSYFGFNSWTSKKYVCEPKPDEGFKELLGKKLNAYFEKYDSAAIPTDNYEIALSNNLDVAGMAAQNMVLSAGSTGTPLCENADMSKLEGTEFKECEKYRTVFRATMDLNGLKNIDVLVMLSLAYSESRCTTTTAGGIMEVDDPCRAKNACPNLKEQLDEGFKKFNSIYAMTKGLAPNVRLTLTLYGYNRGSGSVKKAIDYYKQGIALEKAMYKSCVDIFGAESKQKSSPDGRTWSEYFNDVVKPKEETTAETSTEYYCELAGMGPNYPVRIYDNYRQMCEISGGKISRSSGEITYSVNPSFNVNVDYSFDEYAYAKEKVDMIITSCSAEPDLDACIAKKIKEIELEALSNEYQHDWIVKYNGEIITADEFGDDKKEWVQYCESEEENFFYSFAELYENCINSEDDDCTCALSLDKENNMIIDIKVDGEKTKIILRNSELSYTSDASTENDYYIHGKNQKIILKKSDNKITKTDIEEKQCRIKNKNYLFCIVDKTRQVPVYSYVAEKTGYNYPVIKFNYYIKDNTVPPPLTGIGINDALKAENAVLIEWDKSTATDVEHYNIYYDDAADFRNAEMDTIKKSVSEGGIKMVSVKADSCKTYKSVELAKLSDYVYGPHKYNVVKEDGMTDRMLLVPNELIYLTETGKFLYVLNGIEDSRNYYFAVTAVDGDGNEIDNKANEQKLKENENFKAGAFAVDDLAPEILDVTVDGIEKIGEFCVTLGGDDKKIVLNIKELLKNENGAKCADFERYYLFYKKEGSLSYPLESGMPHMTKTSSSIELTKDDIEAGKEYCFAVVAVDKEGNYIKRFSDCAEISGSCAPDKICTSSGKIVDFVKTKDCEKCCAGVEREEAAVSPYAQQVVDEILASGLSPADSAGCAGYLTSIISNVYGVNGNYVTQNMLGIYGDAWDIAARYLTSYPEMVVYSYENGKLSYDNVVELIKPGDIIFSRTEATWCKWTGINTYHPEEHYCESAEERVPKSGFCIKNSYDDVENAEVCDFSENMITMSDFPIVTHIYLYMGKINGEDAAANFYSSESYGLTQNLKNIIEYENGAKVIIRPDYPNIIWPS